MKRQCNRCGATLTKADTAEHKRRKRMAQEYGSIILQDTTLCTTCLTERTEAQGRAVALVTTDKSIAYDLPN